MRRRECLVFLAMTGGMGIEALDFNRSQAVDYNPGDSRDFLAVPAETDRASLVIRYDARMFLGGRTNDGPG